jgi:hypothetical protein
MKKMKKSIKKSGRNLCKNLSENLIIMASKANNTASLIDTRAELADLVKRRADLSVKIIRIN